MTFAPIARRTLLAAAAVLAVAGCSQAKSGAAGADGDIVVGKPNAPVTLVEYASPTCGACAAFNEQVYPDFKKKYVDTGQVKYVLREAPIHGAVDVAAFLMARCVGTGEKYVGVIDSLLRSQSELQSTGDPRSWLLNTARSAGMTEEQFNQCVTDEAALKRLNERWEKNSRADDVQSTPTILVNGQKIASGVPTLAQLDAAIAAANKK